MTTTVPKCSHCDDTGSLSKQIEGPLDCAHCWAATTRVGLEKWCAVNIPPLSSKSTVAWLLYQHGYAAGLTEQE